MTAVAAPTTVLEVMWSFRDGCLKSEICVEDVCFFLVELDFSRRDANKDRDPFTGWEEWRARYSSLVYPDSKQEVETFHLFPRELVTQQLSAHSDALTAVVLTSKLELLWEEVEAYFVALPYRYEEVIQYAVEAPVSAEVASRWNQVLA